MTLVVLLSQHATAAITLFIPKKGSDTFKLNYFLQAPIQNMFACVLAQKVFVFIIMIGSL